MSGRKIVKDRFFIEDELVETIAEVPVGGGAEPWQKDEKFKVVGKPTPRLDGYDKVSGTATYTTDVSLPHMAHAAILRCPHPHAEIKSIDVSNALKLPGVLAIISHENVPAIPWYNGKTFLFDKRLRYEGDEVACVAAESETIAREALSLIKVDYKTLPFVVDPQKAMKADAPKLYKEGNINRGKPDQYKRGDVKKGFDEADVLVEDHYRTEVTVHNPAEVHSSVANWDGDQLTVWDSTQAIWNSRDSIANALKLSANNVRVIKKYMGGGFGSKLEGGKYTIMAVLLAKKIARPVKILLDRREMNLSVGNRPDTNLKLKLGAKKDGTITALSHHHVGSAGAHPQGTGCSWPLRTLYKCDNVETEEFSVLINTGRARAFRAPGHVQGTFALESLMDQAAEKLGIDPIEFRLKNYAETDQVFKLKYTSKRLREAYKQGAQAINWKNRKAAGQSSSSNPYIKRGMGMASQIWWGGGGPPAYAVLKLNRDGSAQVISGTQDIGTGTYTFMAQIVSEVLEIPLDKISVILGDTSVCPYAPLSGGSLTSGSVSPAVHDAASQMKAKLISGAAAILEVAEDQLAYSKETITAKSDEKKNIKIPDLIGKMRERVLVTTGARNANPKGYIPNTFGAHFAEVEVDTLSGRIKVLRVVAAHDIGRVLNPKTCANQIYGGITQAIGFSLMEQRVMDQETGKMVNPNFHDYKIPTIADIPDIDVLIVSDADTVLSSTGVKGVGEPGMIPTPGAIANAVYNALGVRLKHMPFTPDKVLQALQKA